MQQLGLNNAQTSAKKGFWARQFEMQSTTGQKICDWLFGVVLPIICFVFDPVVFKDGGLVKSGGILGEYRAFAYILCFFSIAAMTAWLIFGARLKWLNACFAGLFLTGALVSLMVGMAIFPYSVLGLVLLIGALGFMPFFTGLIYLRNGWRAFQTAKSFLGEQIFTCVFLLTVIFSVIVPYTINSVIQKSLREIEKGDAPAIRANARILKYAAPLVNSEGIAKRYFHLSSEEEDREVKQAIAETYRELTGKNLEERQFFD